MNWLSFLFKTKNDYISALPSEILWLIFNYLEPRDLSAIGCASSLLYWQSSQHPSWMTFYGKKETPIGMSFKESYLAIRARISPLLKLSGNYQFLLEQAQLTAAQIAAQTEKHVRDGRAQELVHILGDSLDASNLYGSITNHYDRNACSRDTADHLSRYAFTHSTNAWEQKFGLGQYWPGTDYRPTKAALEKVTALIIYASTAEDVNRTLASYKNKCSDLPFIFVIAFNSDMVAEEINQPILQLYHMPFNWRAKFIWNESDRFFSYYPLYSQIWFEIHKTIALLINVKENLQKLKEPAQEFKPKQNPDYPHNRSSCRIM